MLRLISVLYMSQCFIYDHEYYCLNEIMNTCDSRD